jgi:hypothetical protein
MLAAESPQSTISAAAMTRGLMRETQWIEWTRTRLQPRERGDLLTALGSEQKAHLLEHDYVWVKGIGVLWNSADGVLRRARFTHGTHFRTQRGEFYIDSDGGARELSNHGFERPAAAARPPSVSGDLGEYEGFGGSDGFDNAVPPFDAA